MNNATYGKTRKNLRNRVDVRLTRKQQKDYLKCGSKPSYMLQKIFDDNLAAIRQSKAALMFSKPASFVMRILKLSKVLMYEFHYDYVKSKFDGKSILSVTDTNSYLYL